MKQSILPQGMSMADALTLTWVLILGGGLTSTVVLIGLDMIPGAWDRTTWNVEAGNCNYIYNETAIGHMGILGYTFTPLATIALCSIPFLMAKQMAEAKMRHQNFQNIAYAGLLGLMIGEGVAFALCCALPEALDTEMLTHQGRLDATTTTTSVTDVGIDLFIYCGVSIALAAILITVCYQQYHQSSYVKNRVSLSSDRDIELIDFAQNTTQHI